MSTKKPPAIAGVTSVGEALIMTVYPSIASTALGRTLGSLYECVPVKLCGIKLSHLLFTLPTIPVALSIYGHLKVFGVRYVLNRNSVQIVASLGTRLIQQVPLSSVVDVVVRQLPGQEFFPAADIELYDKAGNLLMSLPGVPRADVFAQTITEARDARLQVDSSLSRIKARQTA